MPIYEYECQECQHVLDALQKISDEPLRHCPSCGEAALKKLLSAPRFRLKGSGWYETDFKDKNRRNLADSDKPSSSSGSDTKGAKSTSKVAGDSSSSGSSTSSKSAGDD
jgi:putative FmdB family regulatory protein